MIDELKKHIQEWEGEIASIQSLKLGPALLDGDAESAAEAEQEIGELEDQIARARAAVKAEEARLEAERKTEARRREAAEAEIRRRELLAAKHDYYFIIGQILARKAEAIERERALAAWAKESSKGIDTVRLASVRSALADAKVHVKDASLLLEEIRDIDQLRETAAEFTKRAEAIGVPSVPPREPHLTAEEIAQGKKTSMLYDAWLWARGKPVRPPEEIAKAEQDWREAKARGEALVVAKEEAKREKERQTAAAIKAFKK